MFPNKITMMVGIPLSGKSEYANKLAESENAVLFSSDEFREKLYGNVNHQGNDAELFAHIHKEMKKELGNGRDVVFDATNISSKRRASFVKEFSKYRLHCVYMDTSLDTCYIRNVTRKRKVPTDVIFRMYKCLQIPTYSEGWDYVEYVHQYKREDNINHLRDHYDTVISKESTYEELFETLCYLRPFNNIFELPHDSTYHTFSVSRHTYHVWNHIRNNYEGKDKELLLWSALFHDTGKAECKNFKENSRYANFIGHENVSAQHACKTLFDLGYDDDFIMLVVELVQNHMKMYNPNHNKLIDRVGLSQYERLKVLHEADMLAK